MGNRLVDKVQQPEYTGENRCVPCTVLNVVIAVVGGLVVGLFASRLVGGLVFFGSLVLIYFRGYLVPGTPALTKRYLPANVLALFGKEPEIPTKSGLTGVDSDPPEQSESAASETEGYSGTETVDPDQYFLDIGVLEPCAEEDDLCLTEEFADRWTEEIERLDDEDVSAEGVATSFGVASDNEEFAIERHDDARILTQDGMIVGQWPSNAALLADMGATVVLQAFDSQWDERSPRQTGQLLNGLRLFLESCPDSGGQIEFNQEVVESCCQSHNVLTVTCSESGERLVEFPLDEIEA